MKGKLKSQIINNLMKIGARRRFTSSEINRIADSPKLLDTYIKSSIENSFTELLFRLTNEKYPEKKAKKLWDAILAHRKTLNDALNRDAGILVAALDYLSNIVHEISNPKISPDRNMEFAARLATTDALTGLYSRNVFNITLEKEIIRSIRYMKNLSLLMIDIDNFKYVNDTFGHQEGDRVIIDLVKILNKTIRKADVISRYGGEEFAVLMPETSIEKAVSVADRIRTDIHKVIRIKDHKVSVSIGAGTLSESIISSYDLVGSADRALYIAKNNGKNCVKTE